MMKHFPKTKADRLNVEDGVEAFLRVVVYVVVFMLCFWALFLVVLVLEDDKPDVKRFKRLIAAWRKLRRKA